VRLCLTLRSPTGTSVHHLCRSYRVANLLSQKKLISRPAFIFWGGAAKRLIFHPDDPELGVSRSPGHPPAFPRTISCDNPVKATHPLPLC
jgi:hypothetical protein